LHLIGGRQRGECVACGGPRECFALHVGEGSGQRATLGVLDSAGRQVGEDHQCAFGVYFGPFTPQPARASAQPEIAPMTTIAAETQTPADISRQKKIVPRAKPSSMITTAIQAAGECP